jgi:hypothetical protein
VGWGSAATTLGELQLELPPPCWEDGEAEAPKPESGVVVIDLTGEDDAEAS